MKCLNLMVMRTETITHIVAFDRVYNKQYITPQHNKNQAESYFGDYCTQTCVRSLVCFKVRTFSVHFITAGYIATMDFSPLQTVRILGRACVGKQPEMIKRCL